MGKHQSAPEHSRTDWQTPDHVLNLVRKVGRIMLDPCTTYENPTAAQAFLTAEVDGLSRPWHCADGEPIGLIYCNPPYGRAIGKWVNKCGDESLLHKGTVIALVPANTDTAWYDDAIESADAVCEVRGRLRFKGAPGPAMFGSAVFYYGREPHLFCHVFAELGRTRLL